MDETIAMQEQRRGGRETLLLVGASSDIGLELIRQLAPAKPLVLAHFNQSLGKLERLSQSLPELEIVPLQADLSVPSGVDGLIASITRQQYSPEKIVLTRLRVEISR